MRKKKITDKFDVLYDYFDDVGLNSYYSTSRTSIFDLLLFNQTQLVSVVYKLEEDTFTIVFVHGLGSLPEYVTDTQNRAFFTEKELVNFVYQTIYDFFKVNNVTDIEDGTYKRNIKLQERKHILKRIKNV